MLGVSVAAATVIYFTHPVDPDSEGLLVGVAAALWPFLAFPVAWYLGCEAGEALGAMKGLQEAILPPLLAHLSRGEEDRRWCAAIAMRFKSK
jgi:hypothetical protein